MTTQLWIRSLLPPEDSCHCDKLLAQLAQLSLAAQKVEACGEAGTGLLMFSQFNPDILRVTLDLYGRIHGRLLLLHLGKLSPGHARSLMQNGAADIVRATDPALAAEAILARIKRWDCVDALLESAYVKRNLVGESPVWKGTLRQVVEVSHFTDVPVLIQGESGTGKEHVARLVHELDGRRNKGELVVLDCSTITPELSGSEFFGHERGAFTGAISARDGAFLLADKGTLFLDEVGELPLHLQTQLLRVIQEQTFKRVGGNVWHRTSFRLVCATNRNLWEQVQKGEFRSDLYFRLASFVCTLPPLRDRTLDILPLARHFLSSTNRGDDSPELDTAVEEYLLTRAYPGNIRDLRQMVMRLMCRHTGIGPITLGCIPPDERAGWYQHHSLWHEGGFELAIRRGLEQGATFRQVKEMVEEMAIRVAVDEANGNLQQAALRLGVSDRTVQMRRPRREA